MRHSNLSKVWFLIGLGIHLQVVASLSLTEIFIFLYGPILLLRNHPVMRKDGLQPLLVLSFLVFCGCVLSSVANHCDFQQTLRGVAVTGLITLTVPVAHWLLRCDPNGFKWMLLGTVISNFLSTFIFQNTVDVNMYAGGQEGSKAVESIMSGPVYWISQLGPLVTLFPKGWYYQCPGIYCAVAPIFFALFSILSSESGRSAALGALGTVTLYLIGKKKIRTMKRIGRYFIPLMLCAAVGLVAVKGLYKHAALEGWLGEKARAKYLLQTRTGDSIGRLLMGGRSEVFIGFFACLDKPILGFGPWPLDTSGYAEKFLESYGDPSDYAAYAAYTGPRKVKMIPAHSHIIGFWLWYGIWGLVYWLYIVYVLIRYIRQDCHAIPQWYYWLACGMPGVFWSIGFSPFMGRVSFPLMVVACLLARSVRKGRFILPPRMQREIMMAEHR